MKKTRDVRGKGQAHSTGSGQASAKKAQGSADADPEEIVWPPPLKPRRGLFVVLGILLVGLFAGMLVLYFKTVYPSRNMPQPVERDTPSALSGSR